MFKQKSRRFYTNPIEFRHQKRRSKKRKLHPTVTLFAATYQPLASHRTVLFASQKNLPKQKMLKNPIFSDVTPKKIHLWIPKKKIPRVHPLKTHPGMRSWTCWYLWSNLWCPRRCHPASVLCPWKFISEKLDHENWKMPFFVFLRDEPKRHLFKVRSCECVV